MVYVHTNASDKLASEYYLEFYGREYGVEPAVFRLFNVFGPRQDPSSPYSGVISIFADRALASQPLTVYGDGEQTRDFIYVADVVEILIKALTVHTVVSGPVNVGTGTQTSLLDLIDRLDALLGTTSEVDHQPPRQGDVRHSLADINLLEKRFGFTQSYSFERGLGDLLTYIRNSKSAD